MIIHRFIPSFFSWALFNRAFALYEGFALQTFYSRPSVHELLSSKIQTQETARGQATAMAKHMWPVPQHMRSLKCPVCKATEGDRFFCDQCQTQYCGLCIYPKPRHSCGRQGEPRPATTSKATSPALGAQDEGRASRTTPLPKPPPQRKLLYVMQQGIHPNAWQKGAREGARKDHHGSSSNKQDLRGGKPRRHHSSKDTHRSSSTEFDDLERPLSAPLSATSPSREKVPRAHTRVHKTHKAQRKAPRSGAPHASGTMEQPKQSKHAGRDSKKPRTRPHQQEHMHTDSDEYPPRENNASSSKAHTCPEAQPTRLQDKATQEWEYAAEDGREIELTHTYRIKEKVYNAVSHAIHAGHKLDHNRTTWGLSQLHPATALHILSNLPHAMHTKAQQYVDHCVDDGWHAQSTQQHGYPQPYREVLERSAQTPLANPDRYRKLREKR